MQDGSDEAGAAAGTRGPGAARAAAPPSLSVPKKLAMGLLLPLFLVLAAELVLRAFGRPLGTLRPLFAESKGLWDPGYSGVIRAGRVPYRVEANADGFRGPELRTGADAARVRIAAIGDSMTDGFFVDNDGTYPHFLNAALAEQGHDAEVVNAARGGGSIDRYVGILRTVVLPLEPDVVVVTFVTNDIFELGRYDVPGATDEPQNEPSLGARFVSSTALGEVLIDLYLRLRAPHYEPPSKTDAPLDEARYAVEGGEDYAANAERFMKRYRGTDALILQETLPPDMEASLADYFAAFDAFRTTCAENDIALLFVYIPAYPEIYAEGVPRTMRDRLRERVEAAGVAFLDLTDAMRSGSAEGPLHMAPADYHLNPRGNRVIARAIAAALEREGML